MPRFDQVAAASGFSATARRKLSMAAGNKDRSARAKPIRCWPAAVSGPSARIFSASAARPEFEQELREAQPQAIVGGGQPQAGAELAGHQGTRQRRLQAREVQAGMIRIRPESGDIRQDRGRAGILAHRGDGEAEHQRGDGVVRIVGDGGAGGGFGLKPCAGGQQLHRGREEIR